MPSMLATLGHSYLRHFPIEKGKWRVSAFLRERLGASQAPVRAAVAPKLVMDLDLTDFVQRSIYLDPSYDADLQRVISDHLPEGGVFMDIGANVGFFTLLAARRVGKGGQVHAFEPEPRTYAALRRNIALNRLTNVTAWQLALSDTAGTATLFPHAGGNSGAASLRPLENSGPPVAVELDTYDRLAAERGLPVPSLIKIDVEGAETKVIRGMTQLLSQETKPPILMEISEFSLEKLGSSRQELLGMMRNFGYVPEVVTRVQRSILSASEIYFQFDVLLTPERKLRRR